MKARLEELLATGKPLVADGAMGTMLQAAGLEAGSAPERWNVERPEAIASIHRAYIEAGAQIILTNSFGGSRIRLAMHGLEDRTVELNRAAAQLARQEADHAPCPVIVAGSIGPTGKLLAPLGDLEMAAAVSAFREQARALVQGRVDVLWIETMSDTEEVLAAVTGCRQAAPEWPVVTTMSFEKGGRTMMGIGAEKALETLERLGLLAVGGNCGRGPDEVEQVISRMHQTNPNLVLVAKANAGLPHLVNGAAVYDADPQVMADYARRVYDCGAQIIGACCGSTPDHIRAIAQALNQEAPA
jgi:5-methyltetrahydrofolate--homocysteine methyltransferase